MDTPLESSNVATHPQDENAPLGEAYQTELFFQG